MNLTDWYPGSIKPVRAGWYEVRNLPGALHWRSSKYLNGSRRMFDGTNWRAGWMLESISIFGTHPAHQWRGLKEPK